MSTMYTPLHLTILIEATVMGGGWKPDPNAMVQVEYAQGLEAEGLLTYDQFESTYRATTRGKAHLDALCRVPLPEWRTPWGEMLNGPTP